MGGAFVGVADDATARDLVRSFDGAWAVESLTPNRLTATYKERGVRITKSIALFTAEWCGVRPADG